MEVGLQGRAGGALSRDAGRLWSPAKTVITCGSLCRTDLLVGMGGFREDLFIDLVHTELCLRIRKRGQRVIVCNRALFYHRYGDAAVRKIGPFCIIFHQYPPDRNYYRFRNGVCYWPCNGVGTHFPGPLEGVFGWSVYWPGFFYCTTGRGKSFPWRARRYFTAFWGASVHWKRPKKNKAQNGNY